MEAEENLHKMTDSLYFKGVLLAYVLRVVSLLTGPAIFPHIVYPPDYHPTEETLKVTILYHFLL